MSSATTLPTENRSPSFACLAGFATIILMVGCFCPSASVAANQSAEKGIWNFVLENDLFANADDHSKMRCRALYRESSVSASGHHNF